MANIYPISIVIPNYNGINYLRDCLESLEQSYTRNKEIIIIDNASTDNDYTWVRKDYPHVKWKQLDKNYGFSYAVNEGIKRARGEYILLLNNDTKIEKGMIESLVLAIKRDKGIFAVSSQMLQYHNPQLIDDAGDEYNLLGWAYKRGDGKPVHEYNKTIEVFSACAGAALYRKSILEEIGYFDEHFFAYMEDVDISYRARLYGYKNIYCPQAKVLHIGSATSGSKYNAFKVKLAARNNVYVVYKNMPWGQIVVNLPFLVMGMLIKYAFYARKGFGKQYREGMREAFRTLDQMTKTPFRWRHMTRYIKIEGLLIRNTWRYVRYKIRI